MAHSPIVAIIADDKGIRRSAASLLTQRGFDVRTYAEGVEFLADPPPTNLRCILLEMRMPGMNALEVMQALNHCRVDARVIVLTGHGGIGLAVRAMKLGASDFLTKPCPVQQLVDAVSRAVTEESDSRVTIVDLEAKKCLRALTPRQRDVLEGILRGQQNKIIAWELGLSVRTIEAYRSALLTRMGVQGTADLVRRALAGGMAA